MSNFCKLQESRFRLVIKKNFILRVVRYCSKLPREAVDAPTLDMFKTRLDRTSSNLI